ncbi:cysteine desulfurase family protein [Microbacterium karelineae]|uniref:cysteine desulfurase family protein n=1 Tax=Microbacterium karelineae TaxID=2654283 RepID=UPI0012EAF110|nr:cysteine desulfurase family protein [Microbacterium karelineae]
MYLDHAATTPVRREVLQAMTPFLTSEFGNPSSTHAAGDAALRALEDARRTVARHLGMRAGDVVFTSGGTESNNLGVKGIAIAAMADRGARHVVTTAIEHSSVLASVRYLERVHGFDATIVPVGADGLIDPAAIASALRPDTCVVALGVANNEIGTVQPVDAVRELCRDAGVPLHVDAVQAAGWLPLSQGDEGRAPIADAVAVSGHKLGAPKGTGALAARRRIRVEPLLHGGGQEGGRRSGTESVAGAVAVATALELAERERVEVAQRVGRIRDAFVTDVRARIPSARITGRPDARLPHIASFVFPGVNGEALLVDLDRQGVLASSGSACRAGSTDPSHVLLACGIDPDLARTAVRFSLSHGQTDDLGPVSRALADAVDRLAV